MPARIRGAPTTRESAIGLTRGGIVSPHTHLGTHWEGISQKNIRQGSETRFPWRDWSGFFLAASRTSLPAGHDLCILRGTHIMKNSLLALCLALLLTSCAGVRVTHTDV